MIILLIILFLKYFFLSHFHIMFFPTTLVSFPPGVMLLSRSTTLRDSATNIEKTSWKGAPELERPNRSIVKTECKSTSNFQKHQKTLQMKDFLVAIILRLANQLQSLNQFKHSRGSLRFCDCEAIPQLSCSNERLRRWRLESLRLRR